MKNLEEGQAAIRSAEYEKA